MRISDVGVILISQRADEQAGLLKAEADAFQADLEYRLALGGLDVHIEKHARADTWRTFVLQPSRNRYTVHVYSTD